MRKGTVMNIYDFGYGPVSAHRHSNGGGWVADTATVADTAHVGLNACVSGNAYVSGNSRVSGNAQVYDNAYVSGNALVYGNAEVFGYAQVHGNSRVFGYALVSGNAKVYDNAYVSGNSRVSGNALVSKTPVRISRSDGYDFVIVPCADNVDRIIAGCHYFTFEEAYNHWNKEHPNYEETTIILEALKKLYELQKTS